VCLRKCEGQCLANGSRGNRFPQRHHEEGSSAARREKGIKKYGRNLSKKRKKGKEEITPTAFRPRKGELVIKKKKAEGD